MQSWNVRNGRHLHAPLSHLFISEMRGQRPREVIWLVHGLQNTLSLLTFPQKPSLIKQMFPYLSTQPLILFFTALLTGIKCVDYKTSFTFKLKSCIPEDKSNSLISVATTSALSCCSFSFVVTRNNSKFTGGWLLWAPSWLLAWTARRRHRDQLPAWFP